MRGVANIFSTPSVGIYVDDIPYGSVTAFAEGANFALDSLLGNLERIEVIKGPQGTLFGAASMGGSLRYITRSRRSTSSAAASPPISPIPRRRFQPAVQGRRRRADREATSSALGVSGFYQDNEGFIDTGERARRKTSTTRS